MSRVILRLRRLAAQSRGATMAEYAILVAAIAVVVILAARAFGNSVSTKIDSSATSIGSM
jgi:Flp pilus assembly pilin Flp